MREPLKVRVADERHAIALAQELVGLAALDVRSVDGFWQVQIDGIEADKLVVRVLDAVRRTLAGSPTASARIRLDGREYQLQGE